MMIKTKNTGFSLTEVLMAVGILSIGMMLIATMFPVGIFLTSVAAERTIGAVVADEAFAKIQLYGIVPHTNPANSYDYENEFAFAGKAIDSNEFSYPPIDPCTANRQYYWSALYRYDPNSDGYQFTVFITRKTNPNLKYPYALDADRPGPVQVSVVPVNNNELTIAVGDANVNPPTAIVDDATGKIYRVIERKTDTSGNPVVAIDRNWEDLLGTNYIWVIPPPQTGGRNADIEVYQRIIRF